MLPIPATFIVGRSGKIGARFVDPDYRKRMAIDDLVAALRIQPKAPETRAKWRNATNRWRAAFS